MINKTFLVALLGFASICRVSFGANDQSTEQQITYQCFVISSENPIPHDFSKLTNRSGTDIVTTPAVTSHAGREARISITREFEPEYVNGQKAQSPIPLGISITLTGKMESTGADAPKISSASTSLETNSSDLYFSRITKSGDVVWFDVDRLFLKGGPFTMGDHLYRYATLRIVPTLELAPAKP